MRTAIDSNILSAIWLREPNALELTRTMVRARREGSLVICGAVLAEVMASPYVDESFIDNFLGDTGISADLSMKEEIWRLAGVRYRSYVERRRRHQKNFERRLLADYIIGAHAVLTADRLMTRDRRYERDFPELGLI